MGKLLACLTFVLALGVSEAHAGLNIFIDMWCDGTGAFASATAIPYNGLSIQYFELIVDGPSGTADEVWSAPPWFWGFPYDTRSLSKYVGGGPGDYTAFAYAEGDGDDGGEMNWSRPVSCWNPPAPE